VFVNPVVEPRETRAMVLVYHEFNRGSDKLSVKTRDFEDQLDWLEENGVEIVSVSELLDFLDGKLALPARVAVITIDDAWKSVYVHAWPILQRRKVRFTIGVPTGMLEDPKNAPVMSWDQVREMVGSGLAEVASHGHMHRALSHLSGRWLKEELELSRDLIEKRIGKKPVAYFYPLGAFNEIAGKRVKAAGYRAGFRATGAPIFLGSGSRWWLPRMGIFRGDGAWIVARFFSKKRLAQVRR
jgi:peptidoglycan/xylan/chitin deacetylase (PgdA/CDA1 family)